MKPSYLLCLPILFLIVGCNTAEKAPAGSRAIAFEETAASCMLCHSGQEAQRGPVLNGVDAWYLEHQLKKFKSGIRGHNPTNKTEQLMGSTLDLIQDRKTMKKLASYISKQEPVISPPVLKGNAEKGREVYNTHCVNCHGDDGKGKRLLKSPPLIYFEDWYMLTQLNNYKSGRRGAHPDDKTGQTMAASVKVLEKEDLKDVVVFIRETLTPDP